MLLAVEMVEVQIEDFAGCFPFGDPQLCFTQFLPHTRAAQNGGLSPLFASPSQSDLSSRHFWHFASFFFSIIFSLT